MRIHFLPWHQDRTGRSNPRVVRADWWMVINHNTNAHHDKKKSRAVNLTWDEEMESVATTFAATAQTVPWMIPGHLFENGFSVEQDCTTG